MTPSDWLAIADLEQTLLCQMRLVELAALKKLAAEVRGVEVEHGAEGPEVEFEGFGTGAMEGGTR